MIVNALGRARGIMISLLNYLHAMYTMVELGTQCPVCNQGTMQLTGFRVVDSYTSQPYTAKGEQTGFQCDNPECMSRRNNVSVSVRAVYNIECSPKLG